MKLMRLGEAGEEKPAVVLDGFTYFLPGFAEDYDEHFFASDGINRLKVYLNDRGGRLPVALADIRVGCPVARPSKIVAVGLNYLEHIKATGLPFPKEPVIFLKANSAICGPNDHILLPPASERTDWETELAVIIGKKASYVTEKDAMDHIAGYALMNDISERSYQMDRNGTVDKGKGCDTFCPLGPYLVTRDELDPNGLNIWFKVNEQTMQAGNTSDLYFKIPFLISYISQFMTLMPGDVVATGTPSGTGHRQSPPVYLKSGDFLEYGIAGLGNAKHTCRETFDSP
jgi:2,4-diketo-3-deoxy-L-fuconate hydrolase